MSDRSGRHQRYEELISASLTGDLSAAERSELEAHLGDCAICRATMAAFGEQRRMVGGLRHVQPPRDLNARVRGAIAAGAAQPWWRRPPAMIAGITGAASVVAGALLALVIINTENQNVADTTTTPSPSIQVASTSPSTTAAPASSAPTPTPVATPIPTQEPTPPAAIGFGAVNFLELNGTNVSPTLTLEGWDPRTQTETDEPLLTIDGASGDPPVVSELSPDGHWLAYQAPAGLQAFNEITVVHPMTGQTFALGATPDGSVFSERMVWDAGERFLAFTRADPDGNDRRDVWLFDTATQALVQLTNSGNAYVGSFAYGDGGTLELWVSTAGETPSSHLLSVSTDAAPSAVDPAQASLESQPGVFQPMLSPDGRHAIYWRGAMEQQDRDWWITSGGMLYVTGESVDGGPNWSDAARAPVFPDLPIEQDAMTSARVAWSFDSNWFAVWDVQWAGVTIDDPAGGPFPNPDKVYTGEARVDGHLIALDQDSWHLSFLGPDDIAILDVAFIGPEDGAVPSIAVSIMETSPGESGESPVATSRMVVAPAGASDASGIEIGADSEWAGAPMYIPQGGGGS
jgi:hypothetical protein